MIGGVSLRNGGLALVAASLLSLGTLPARAALIAENSPFGADTLTLDTSTGLEWLDVTLTQNRSMSDIASRLGTGQQFAGFRYALAAEIHGLILGAGISAEPLDTSTTAVDVAAVGKLIGLLGQTFLDTSFGVTIFGTIGLTGQHGSLGFGQDDVEFARLQVQDPPGPCAPDGCADALALSAAQNFGADQALPRVGSFLVRAAPAAGVPEPATLVLLAVNLLALAAWRAAGGLHRTD